MDILSFNRISKPHMEVAAEINLAPKARWFVEVMDTDGAVRPAGPCANGEWIDNVVLNGIKDTFLGANYPCGRENGVSPLKFFLNSSLSTSPNTPMRVGTSNAAVAPTQTGLQAYSTSSSGPYVSGNSASVDPTTGNVVLAIKQQWAAETGPKTYYEAGLFGGNNGFGTFMFATTANGAYFNRVLIPGGVSLTAGQALILTCALTIPTLAVNGQTVTLSAQSGMNISGTLKLIGTTSSIVGGTVTAGGVVTSDSSNPLFPFNDGTTYPKLGLTTASSFPAFNSNTTGMQTNAATTTSLSTYITGTYYRDIVGSWNSAYSVASFQSICLSTGGVNGYQLLLNNPMSKATGAILNFALRFAIA